MQLQKLRDLRVLIRYCGKRSDLPSGFLSLATFHDRNSVYKSLHTLKNSVYLRLWPS